MWILELKGLTACVSLKGDQRQFSPSSNISTKSRKCRENLLHDHLMEKALI